MRLRGMEIQEATIPNRIAELNPRPVDFDEQRAIAAIRIRNRFRNHTLGTGTPDRIINMMLRDVNRDRWCGFLANQLMSIIRHG